MSEVEQAFEVIKNIWMDKSIPKTKGDIDNFKRLISSIKFRIKAKLLSDIVAVKSDEAIKVFSDIIADLNNRINEAEQTVDGQGLSFGELVDQKHEVQKLQKEAKLKAYKEMVSFLQGLSSKVTELKTNERSEDARRLIERMFSQELKADRSLRKDLVCSLATGYFSFFQYGDRFISRDMYPGRDGLSVPHSDATIDVDFSYVDDVMAILLDPEKIEKYREYFDTETDLKNQQKLLEHNQDAIHYLTWYQKNKGELDALLANYIDMTGEIELANNTIREITSKIESLTDSIDNLKSNKLKELINKHTIEELEEQLVHLQESLEDKNKKLIIFKNSKQEAENGMKLLVQELEGVMSREGYIGLAFVQQQRLGVPFRKDTFSYPVSSVEKLESVNETKKATIEELKTKLEAILSSMTPEMREDVSKNHDGLKRILKIKTRDTRYGLTPFISLAILKVMGDVDHLSPDELFAEISPNESYEDFSETVKAEIERYLSLVTALGAENSKKVATDKFRTYDALKDEPVFKEPEVIDFKTKEIIEDDEQTMGR